MMNIVKWRQSNATGIFLLSILLLNGLAGRFTMPRRAHANEPAIVSSETVRDSSADSDEKTFHSSTPRAEIRIDNRKVLEVTGETWPDALMRAERINGRLEKVVRQNESLRRFVPQDIITRNAQSVITIGGEPVLTVTASDSRAHAMATQKLALLWGDQLSLAVAEARAARAHPLGGIRNALRDLNEDQTGNSEKWLQGLAGALLTGVFFWVLGRLLREMNAGFPTPGGTNSRARIEKERFDLRRGDK